MSQRLLASFLILATLLSPLTVLPPRAQASPDPSIPSGPPASEASQLAAIATQLSYLQSLLQSITSGVSALFTSPSASAQASSITMGETNILGSDDCCNAGLLLAQQATLSQTATVESLSFYVATAAGNLRLGIYDATGLSGGPGQKKAETNQITPVVGWNTANVITPISLSAGTYWLAYTPSDNNLHFRRNGTGSFRMYSFTYGPLPTAFSTTPQSGVDHWSFYATLSTTPDTTPPTVSLTSPSSGATLSNTTTVSATASDNTAVSGVQFLLDGANLQAEDTTSPYTISWDTTTTTNGSHTLAARARDAAGNTTTSSNITVTTNNVVLTPDVTAPSTPTNLQATAQSSTQINLTWTASTDPTVAGQTTSGVTGYRVERCTGASCTNFTQIGTPTTNSYSDTGLTANTTYRYQVRAVDGAGNLSGYSGVVTGTTQIVAPSSCPGTCFYIRQGATGSSNGSDWSNAYGSLPAALQRGAIYYVADGTYSGYTFDDAVSGTSVITIKKAIASDHGTDTGWTSTYGDGQAAFGNFIFRTSNYLVDGQTRNENTYILP